MACSTVKTQRAIVFVDDGSTENRPIKGNLTIYGSKKEPIVDEIIEKAAQADDKSKKSEKLEWNEECNSGEGCFYVGGKELEQVDVVDFYESTEGFEIELPINENGKAILRIQDGNNSAEWRLTPSTSEAPIYLNLLITDFFVSLTELEDGKLTYTSVSPNKFEPEHQWYFTELYPEDARNYFERDNPWMLFRLMNQKYSIAKDKANEDTCEIFGKDCNGRASYTKIAKSFRAAYDDILIPLLSELSTSSQNKDVSVALLKLEKMAKLLADCYFRSYSAADDSDSSAYSATSECFSDVRQQESDLEIYLKEFGTDLTGFMRAGTH